MPSADWIYLKRNRASESARQIKQIGNREVSKGLRICEHAHYLAEGEQSAVFDEAENRLHTEKAVLNLLLEQGGDIEQIKRGSPGPS